MIPCIGEKIGGVIKYCLNFQKNEPIRIIKFHQEGYEKIDFPT